MSDSGDDFERTIVFGESALDRIRAYRHPAYPRIYEVWYTYATCYNPLLNQAINDVLRKRGTLSEQDLDALYDMHLSASRFPTRYDEVGTKIREEVDQIVSMLDAARGSANAYGDTLDGVTRRSTPPSRPRSKWSSRRWFAPPSTCRRPIGELETQLLASREEMLKMHDTLEALRAESLTDPLTLLSNRKYLRHGARKGAERGQAVLAARH